MPTLHIFNPETDIILGLNQPYYTPGKYIAIFKKQLALLPAIYAAKGDYILVEDLSIKSIDQLPFYTIAKEKGLLIMSFKELQSSEMEAYSPGDTISRIEPWGWNKEICRKLSEIKLNSSLLPDDTFLSSLRKLSHRQTTTIFFSEYSDLISPNFSTPLLIKTNEEADNFINRRSDYCLKAPWSSSGRGILFSNTLSVQKTLEWMKGIIRSQGSLVAEKLYDRNIDFASEWYIEKNGNITFSGLSLFKSSNRGKYQGNILISQDDIQKFLINNSKWNNSILNTQELFIKKYISPFYCGPVGFDMLVDRNGDINPCVEINIRRTMGHVSIEIEKALHNNTNPHIRRTFEDLFPDNIFSLKRLLNEEYD